MKRTKTWVVASLATLGLISPALALNISVGENGIYALELHEKPYNLIGRKIGIGQVEIGRPGKFGFDKAVSWNPAMKIAGVFHRDSLAEPNTYVDNHAAMVASVMVSPDKKLRGVAPGAKLYASAVGSLRQGGQPEECISSQHVALQNGGDVRAINFSFGESLDRDPREDATLDGNALLTLCVDWSSRVHDTLYVIAGNQGSGGIPIPTDHFNGITTAYTTKRDNRFIKVDFGNLSAHPVGIGRLLIQREINTGGRRAINLVAPGHQVNVYNLEGNMIPVTGTSFAAPHITASVALLQEFGDRQLKNKQSNWSLDSRRHEVSKAVLLNSADKIQDTGDGLLLGMNRTTLGKDNLNWLDSDAYQDPKVPLDIQMGTGHLNAFRAYQQFSGGEGSPDQPVGNIGWDYGEVERGNYQDYVIEEPLRQGSFAAVTLAWDRLVELNDSNNNKQFDVGESFSNRGLNNLDVFLMPADSDSTRSSTCSSISDVDSVEHIFCPIPATGKYKIRVQYREQVNENVQSYGLAWWTKGNRE